MNYVLHLNAWMSFIGADQRLKSQHYALYMALFYEWNQTRFRTPIMVNRAEVMRNAGIGSINFYIRTIKELSSWGYIRYEPSFDRFKGSLVYLHKFYAGSDKDSTGDTPTTDDGEEDNKSDKGCEHASSKGCDNATGKGRDNDSKSDKGSDTGGDKGCEHGRDKARESLYINNTNSINTINSLNSVNDYGTSNENSNFVDGRGAYANPQTTGTGNHHRQKQTAGAGGRGGGRSADAIPASVEEAQEYFVSQKSTAAEAQKFCDHYQAVGWVKGRNGTPITDWRAAARNWIENAKKFNHANNNGQPKPGPLTTGPKNYAEPF